MAKAEKKIGKTTSYGQGTPPVPFQTFMEYVPNIAQHGTEGTFDPLVEVFDSNVNDGYFKKKLQTGARFELIEYDFKDKTYRLMPDAVAIAHPISEQHKTYYTQRAFLNHPIVTAIFEATSGNVVPQNVTYFANLIAAKCNIPAGFKDQWARYFLAGARYCGLVRQRPNGDEYVISKIVEPDGGEELPPPPPPPPPPGGGKPNGGDGTPKFEGDFVEKVHLPLSADRTLYLYIPAGGLKENDIKKIKIKLETAISGLEAYRIEGE